MPDQLPRLPVRVAANLLPRIMDQLELACAWTGGSKTDAINRAVSLYGMYCEAASKGETFCIVGADGTPREIHFL